MQPIYNHKINIGMSLVEKGGILAYISPGFKKYPNINHFFSTRKSGVSSGAYESLNLSWRRNDLIENIKTNYSLACGAFGMDWGEIVFAEQTHSDHVSYVTFDDRNKYELNKRLVSDTDALITDQKGLILTARTADCVPILIYDPRGAIAAVHSGWKGTLNNISGKTIAAMKVRFGSEPSKLIAAIGPSIGPCCFEVGNDVAAKFAENGYHNAIKENEDKNPSIDLWSCCIEQLLESGLMPETITLAGVCTSCRGDLFFSHRRDKGNTGGMAAFIQLI